MSSRPRKSGQIEIDQSDVGPQVEIGGEAGRAVLRLEHLDVGIRLQKRPASRYDDRVVVDDENPQQLDPSIAAG